MNRHLRWHWNKSNMWTQRGNILDATIKGVLVSMWIQFVDSLQYSLCFPLGEVKKMPVPVKGKWHFWAPTAYFAASVLKSVPPEEIFISWGHLKPSSSICLSTPRHYNSYFWIAFIWVKSNELPFWRKLGWDKTKIIFLKKQSNRFCFFNWSHSHILDECKSVEFSQSAVCPPWQCLNCPWGLTDSGSRQPWDGFALCCNWISQKCSWPSFPFLEKWQSPLTRVSDTSERNFWTLQWPLTPFWWTHLQVSDQIFTLGLVAHPLNGAGSAWNLGKLYSVFASDYGGGALNVQDSSTENKPAWGKREKKGERQRGRREGGGKERAWLSLSGDIREKTPVQLNKNCAIFTRTARCGRGGPILSRLGGDQLCVLVIGASATTAKPEGNFFVYVFF